MIVPFQIERGAIETANTPFPVPATDPAVFAGAGRGHDGVPMDSRFLSRSGLARVQSTMRTLGARRRSPRTYCAACARPIAPGEVVRLHGVAYHRRCAVYSAGP